MGPLPAFGGCVAGEDTELSSLVLAVSIEESGSRLGLFALAIGVNASRGGESLAESRGALVLEGGVK
ncbi:hypothetical protein Aph01nite_57580 [Acrocarpospora phusangensis]|uniref:Uncharacterized protein n=1 Tax=Acrocarpospora phusangensis TaxID=1070424 RepID=A0A919QH38_9ACTN|nr:hypothetical protein Aph01nite_57580 [Acrocarpospora phusangensis]